MQLSHPIRTRYDVIVVGARCAGAATALLLARRGLRVLAVDRGRYGSDTLSTHALMRPAVLQLARWGVLPRLVEAGTPPVRRTSFHYGEEEVPVEIKPRDGVDALYAPRRTLLDTLLVDAALEAGADVRHSVRVKRLIRSPSGRVRGAVVEGSSGERGVRADVVIGADGARSTVARHVEAPVRHVGRHASGIVYGYWSGLEVNGYHWHYRPGSSVGVIPTDDGATCVFVAAEESRFAREIRADIAAGHLRLLRECAPELAERLEEARRVSTFRGFPGLAGFLRQGWGRGWALVGDAGYFKDPLTAHGITDALRDAELLARAVSEGTEGALAEYEEIRDVLSLPFFRVTDELASFDWDLETVKRHHLTMSREMNREVEAILGLEPEASAVA